MKTKIAYALTSDPSDYYLEQLILSLYTLRKYNQDAWVTLVVDKETNILLGGTRSIIKDIVEEFIVVETPQGYDKKTRSRYIKTTIRKYIKGRYLFIDTDTIIMSDLSMIDGFHNDIMAVLDRHVTISENQMYFSILKQAKQIGWQISETDEYFFNSGVMLVEDAPIAYTLYEEWHKNWIVSYQKGLNIDQPALAISNKSLNYIIKQLPDIWNCQILGNGLRYLNNALILHYFNSNTRSKLKNHPYKLTESLVFEKLCNNNYIVNDEIASMINNPKSLFSEKYEILSSEALNSYYKPSVQLILYLYSFHPALFKIVDGFANTIFRISDFLKNR